MAALGKVAREGVIGREGFSPNSEAEIASRAAARGAHAAGVQFSAARRKPRTTHFYVRGEKLVLGHDGSGWPPKPARGPRALPIPISEFARKWFLLSVFTRVHPWFNFRF